MEPKVKGKAEGLKVGMMAAEFVGFKGWPAKEEGKADNIQASFKTNKGFLNYSMWVPKDSTKLSNLLNQVKELLVEIGLNRKYVEFKMREFLQNGYQGAENLEQFLNGIIEEVDEWIEKYGIDKSKGDSLEIEITDEQGKAETVNIYTPNRKGNLLVHVDSYRGEFKPFADYGQKEDNKVPDKYYSQVFTPFSGRSIFLVEKVSKEIPSKRRNAAGELEDVVIKYDTRITKFNGNGAPEDDKYRIVFYTDKFGWERKSDVIEMEESTPEELPF